MNVRKLFIIFLLASALLGGNSILNGCAECSYDTDCGGNALCIDGVCQEKKKKNPPKKGTFICMDGEQRACYSGPQGTENQGICKSGTQFCANGRWGICQGEVLPESNEKCDGIDNNCDGHVDEGCTCKDGERQKCYTGPASTRNQGLCHEGEQICSDGQWGPCLKQQLPQKEKCDGKDNNCNGKIDEGVVRKCQSKCGIGEEICVNGQFQKCTAAKPEPETCGDNKDNDCDGSVDEGCECTPGESRFCYTGKAGTAGEGPCKKGKQKCSHDGKWLDCIGQVVPQIEKCNKIDDDCNGRIDDGLKRACHRGCNTGEEFCQNGKWEGCNAAPSDPEVCDGKDNDCNGKIDDLPNGQKCECLVGQKQICYDAPKNTLGKGICKAGEKLCQAGGKWSLCVGQVLPTAEACDGKDNDCDGYIDNQPNSTNTLSRPCYDADPSTAGKGKCRKGIQYCRHKQWTSCVGQVLPKKEECNNQDDDCNGKIDDNLTRPCYSGKQGTAGIGQCRKGIQTCHAGRWGACQGEIVPMPEKCNKKDDDCDQQIDEDHVCDVCKAGQKKSCYTGPIQTRYRSPCHSGTSSCINGQWGQCLGERTPQPEQCNNKDDDCDGLIDNNVTRPCRSICGKGKEICHAGHWGPCDAPKPTKEICDGLDNDCDGKVDEGLRCEILASADSSGKIIFWDPSTFKYRRSITSSGAFHKLAFSQDKKYLAVASSSGVSFFALPLGIHKFTLPTGNAIDIAFSSNSKEIAVATSSNEIQIWTVATHKRRLKIKGKGSIKAIAFNANNRWIAYSSDKYVYFLSSSTGKLLNSTKMSFFVNALTASYSGDYFLAGGYYIFKILGIPIHIGKGQLWKASSLPPNKELSFPSTGTDTLDLAFSKDSSLVGASNKSSISVWERTSGKLRLKVKPDKGNWIFHTLAIDSTNKLVAFGGYDKDQSGYGFYIYDISQSPPVSKLTSTIHRSPVKCVRFQP